MEEEKKDNFDELSFEDQMKVLQVRRNASATLDSLDEAMRRNETFNALLEAAKGMEDTKMLNGILFSGAEYFEQLKPLPPDGHEYDAVKSKALDWLRHVLNVSPESVKFAVDAIDHLTRGMFGEAREDFGYVRIMEDEFKVIEDYYKEALA